MLLLLQARGSPFVRLNYECVEGEEWSHFCHQTKVAQKWCFAVKCVACNGGSLFLIYVQMSNLVCLYVGLSA